MKSPLNEAERFTITRDALPEVERGPMSLVRILKRFVSVFTNASRRCRKLNENSVFVGILEKGIAMHCKETITVLQFLS